MDQSRTEPGVSKKAMAHLEPDEFSGRHTPVICHRKRTARCPCFFYRSRTWQFIRQLKLKIEDHQQDGGKTMSIPISQYKNFRISPGLKRAIIAGICASCLVLAVAIVYLSLPNYAQVVSYLSEVRVTPSWPQIGTFSSP